MKTHEAYSVDYCINGQVDTQGKYANAPGVIKERYTLYFKKGRYVDVSLKVSVVNDDKGMGTITLNFIMKPRKN